MPKRAQMEAQDQTIYQEMPKRATQKSHDQTIHRDDNIPTTTNLGDYFAKKSSFRCCIIVSNGIY